MTPVSYPLRHVSIRVPWHDNGWNGSVCKDPTHNTACLKLVNIARTKNETQLEQVAGLSLKELDPGRFPPCVKERGTFMAPFALERFHEHPYAETSPDTHSHFRPTSLRYPAYGAAALPFRWMMKSVVFGDPKNGERGLVNEFPLHEVDDALEPELKFESHWIQDHRNHRALLGGFWDHVRPEESLVFFYAKQVPLVDDIGKRVLIGAGRVLKIGPLTEYKYEGLTEGMIRSLLWERMVVHSIREGFDDGFLMPYQQALMQSNDGESFDPAEVVAFAPDDRFNEFSYATEHVGNDAAISALLSCRNALLRASELFPLDIQPQERWIDRELGRLWKKRGAFPGLGQVLSATGVGMGSFVAQALQDKVGDEGNPWEAWRRAIAKPKAELPAELARHIDATLAKAWQRMAPERQQFLELLSRFDISHEQADVLAIPEARLENGVPLSDKEFIANPYLFFETTRLSSIPVSLGIVDRGVYPTPFVRDTFPLPMPTGISTPVDGRRLRALVVQELERAANEGDTLLSKAEVITRLRAPDSEKQGEGTEVTADLMAVVEEDRFAGELRVVEMADDRPAYQLERLAVVGELIRTRITGRAGGKRLSVTADWRRELDELLGPASGDADERAKEERARQEKSAALKEIAASRFSVLIGPAGTGKTTLLSVLCRRPEVQSEGILMLAPTGKARVRMEDVARRAGVTNLSAKTLAQFLSASGRYDGATQRYLLTGAAGEKTVRTVIVDECSMLTEEMLGALLEALSGVHRLVLVGDPRQLPPIGAGRPFADIVSKLQPSDIESRIPRIGVGYAELTVPRRQDAGEREDMQLAAWFGGSALSPGEDQVFELLSGKRKSNTVQFETWETPKELESKLPEVLATSLNFDPALEEWQAFAKTIGGQVAGQHVYFNRGRSGAFAEAWQILSPTRQKPWGVESINRFIHRRYKSNQVDVAQAPVPPWKRRITKPSGDQQIVYGDKVINNRNSPVYKKRVYPEPTEGAYLANGEIGIVVGQLRTKNWNYEPKAMEVEFSTQQHSSFKFYPSEFDDEHQARLELAYALTVHKAQGSEFDVLILILPRSPIMLTRELLYTALTRQKQKLVILHQGSAIDLQRLSSEKYSATARRRTNLFGAPRPVLVGDSFLEDRLIHRTARGEAVRSKSEVIIANLLHANKINYHYEHPLEKGGVVKYPDFTIEDDNTGITYYWEHCGMLQDPAYNKRWERKKVWYRDQGIREAVEGGEQSNILIETHDRPNGGIDSAEIDRIIRRIVRP